MTTTRAQREAMFAVFRRGRGDFAGGSSPAYRTFRRTCRKDYLLGCITVPWAGMLLGIEPDGYIHS